MRNPNYAGFTLIEIMLSLGIIGIIILMLFPLFSISIQIFQKTDDSAELQYQGQFAMNFMGNKIMEAVSIEAILNEKNKDITDQIPTDKIRISKMVFAKPKPNDKNEVNIFEVKYDKLFYGVADSPHKSATTEVAAYIKEIWVLPFPEGRSFTNAKTLQIIMHLAKNRKNTEIVGTFHLRNYKTKENTD